MASGDDLRAQRIAKLDILKTAGMEAYPAHSLRNVSVSEFFATFEERESSGTQSTIAGRVLSLRGQGGIMFATLFDGTGRGQVVFQKSEVDDALYILFEQAVERP